MDSRNFSTALIGLCLCFSLVISEETDCKCPGPLKYYKEIGCTPVFKKPGDCCPERYNCDQLKDLPNDKCFLNGRTYNIGDALRDEDANACDISCVCREGFRGPQFSCAAVSCPSARLSPGCYRKHDPKLCCGGPEICPEKDEDRATCVVDGVTYRDGDYFKPAGEPEKHCYCGEGYTGKNVKPFCTSPEDSSCGTMLRHSDEIRGNCIPTFYYDQSPKADCSLGYRCQNDKDTVIATSLGDSKSATKEAVNTDMLCKFGNLTMQVGDELNQATDYSSVCMKCVCEVPPVPTCQRLSDEECDITKHPDF